MYLELVQNNQIPTERLPSGMRFEPGIFLLRGDSANYCTTGPPQSTTWEKKHIMLFTLMLFIYQGFKMNISTPEPLRMITFFFCIFVLSKILFISGFHSHSMNQVGALVPGLLIFLLLTFTSSLVFKSPSDGPKRPFAEFILLF